MKPRRLGKLPSLVAAPAPRLQGLATAGTGFARADDKSSAARGYGADWRKVRAAVLRAEPTCRLFRAAPATEVDHIERFHGLSDPRRLARTNVRPVCAPCHRARTARQSHGQG